ERLSRWVDERPRLMAALQRGRLEEPAAAAGATGLEGHAIVVGHGRVGSVVAETLDREGIPYVVVEQDREIFEALRDRGVPAVYGNAARKTVFALTRPERARLLVVAMPDPFQTRAVMDFARLANRAIETIVRAHSADERTYLERHGANRVVIGEHELALTMARHALGALGPGAPQCAAAS
ncbi:MAG TPA: NAD-binding protein, partial [Gemmatimonadales bacterium]|nr:NAD-binding protein [Gemmatimonadales bacterium]